jgi:aldehyde dehydrogenase (NAD+)
MTEQLVRENLSDLRASHKIRITQDLRWRQQQLEILLKGIKKMSSEMCEACFLDLGRSKQFTMQSEIHPVMSFVSHTIDQLPNYMKKVHTDPSVIFSPCSSYVQYEPLGVALILGSWNFPYFVTIKPLVMAIAAGNCAIIKPSELG